MPTVIKGTVADWRDVSFFADMNGRRLLADELWSHVEGQRKDRVVSISFKTVATLDLVRHIALTRGIELSDLPP